MNGIHPSSTGTSHCCLGALALDDDMGIGSDSADEAPWARLDYQPCIRMSLHAICTTTGAYDDKWLIFFIFFVLHIKILVSTDH